MTRQRRAISIALLLCAACCAAVVTRAANQPQTQPPIQPQRLFAAGTPQQIGAAMGREFGPVMRDMHPKLVAIAMAVAGQPKDVLYQRAAKIAQYIDPADIRQIHAMADAAGMDYADALFGSCFYTLTSRHTLACRGLAVWGPRTVDGQLIHARNLDWIDYPGDLLTRNHLILNVAPQTGHRFVLLTWPGLIAAVTGTNDVGITVSYDQLYGGDRIDRLAESTFFTLKRVLHDCDNLDDAVALIQKAKPLDDGTVLISDAKHNAAAVVEIVDGHVGVRRPADGESMIGNANHATAEAGIAKSVYMPVFNADWPTCIVVRQYAKPVDPAEARRILANPLVLQGPLNMLAVVFEPTENRMWLSVAPHDAAEQPFKQYQLFPDTAATAQLTSPKSAATADTASP
jgi:Acyl-coenzyme A:6-aminopenicillanic acid acyl-transferase